MRQRVEGIDRERLLEIADRGVHGIGRLPTLPEEAALHVGVMRAGIALVALGDAILLLPR